LGSANVISAFSAFRVQLYCDEQLGSLRSKTNRLTTLEFYNNSCWMESAVNSFFAIPIVRHRIFVDDSLVSHPYRRLLNAMVVYGHICHNQVPIIECIRCGVYPLFGHDATSPPISAGAGYGGGIFSCGDEPKWGALGAFDVVFQRFLCSIGMS
jgi:hypothetical protein